LKKDIYKLCETLWPINRSITGEGVRKTLEIIKKIIPNLVIKEIPSGTKCFDWTVPYEWSIKDAYIIDPDGKKIVDFKENNLHVLGYSTPVNKLINLSKLEKHLYSLPDLPNAIPYVTSYYKKRWGFCIQDNVRKKLKKGLYRVLIDSSHKQGSLTYGELIIPGEIKSEIFLSTYVCHPSMANNELSGPAVTTYLAKWINTIKTRYSYRIIFIPETIGSICYLQKNLLQMQQNIIAGFNITCVGDDNCFSFVPSRIEDSIADRAAKHVLRFLHPDYVSYSFLDRGSDERQYCSPGVDLPVVSIMRSKYREYIEYHTSLDNLDFISPEGLFGSFEAIQKAILCLENNCFPVAKQLCEPFLSKRNLRSSIGGEKTLRKDIALMMDLLIYSDGNRDLISIAEKINCPLWELIDVLEKLKKENLIELHEHKD